MIRLQWDAVFAQYDIDHNRKLDLRELEMMISHSLPEDCDLGWVRKTARKMMIQVWLLSIR